MIQDGGDENEADGMGWDNMDSRAPLKRMGWEYMDSQGQLQTWVPPDDLKFDQANGQQQKSKHLGVSHPSTQGPNELFGTNMTATCTAITIASARKGFAPVSTSRYAFTLQLQDIPQDPQEGDVARFEFSIL